MSPTNPHRPTIAPDVIVEQVSANANWKTQNARSGTPVEPYVSARPFRKNPVVPMNPFPGSNMNAKPHAQKVTPQMQVSTMPSTRMLIDSRDRANPASSMTNPTCIPNTRNAAISVHAVLMALTSGDGPAGAGACAESAGARKTLMVVSRRMRPMAFPPMSASTFARKTGSLKLVVNRFQSVLVCIGLSIELSLCAVWQRTSATHTRSPTATALDVRGTSDDQPCRHHAGAQRTCLCYEPGWVTDEGTKREGRSAEPAETATSRTSPRAGRSCQRTRPRRLTLTPVARRTRSARQTS